MSRRPRFLPEDDLALFHRVLADVMPLREQDAGSPSPASPREPLPEPSSAPVIGTAKLPVREARAREPAMASGHRPGHVPGLDRRSALRLKRGQVSIDATLDLHGMTQARARAELDRFLGKAISRGHRTLLVITGKGDRVRERWNRDDGPGVLRRRVPAWLRDHPQARDILAISNASPAHGGAGALYVVLRRHREPLRPTR
ncbi:MAG: Smr/MutS family protein [Alphaproteobacteria bacterium]|nr:Smr/MutS family protein [Alphaproteobacteria bacterium]